MGEEEAGSRLFQVLHDPKCTKSGVNLGWVGGVIRELVYIFSLLLGPLEMVGRILTGCLNVPAVV